MVDAVSLTALIIAVVALVTAVGQFLAQLFATADGLRRCRRSVMGSWAAKTQRRFRWKELRVETLYAVPRLRCGGLYTRFSDIPMSKINTHFQDDALASWVRLVDAMRENHKDALSKAKIAQVPMSLPWVTTELKSWDFVPSGVLRPMAVSTLGEIAVIARRLGMWWKRFDPNEGVLLAEGQYQVLSAQFYPFVGITFQYNQTKANLQEQQRHYIPDSDCDQLGFGLIVADPGLMTRLNGGTTVFRAGNLEDVRRMLSGLMIPTNERRIVKVSDIAAEHISTGGDALEGFMMVFNDLLPLTARLMAPDFTYTRRIPCPNMYGKGVLASTKAYNAFEEELQAFISAKGSNASDQSMHILQTYQNLCASKDSYGPNTEMWNFNTREREKFGTGRDSQEVLTAFWKADQYLKSSTIVYRHLLGEHMSMAFPDNFDASKDEAAHIKEWFQRLPHMATTMAGKERPPSAVEDAWITMIFRALCWNRCHMVDEGITPVPSLYWNSQLPVYIG